MAKKLLQRGDRGEAGKQSRESRGGGSYSGHAQDSPERPAAEGGEGGGALKIRALWVSSLVLIISGYFLLRRVDPGGQNIWAAVSPALLLAGYLLLIPAIVHTYRGKS